MNVQHFANLGGYLRDLARAVNRQAALQGSDAFNVELVDGGLTESDVTALR